MGYYYAGFEIVGVDNRPQPRYPFEFHLADAMTYPLEGFDVIHTSPPCQAYSRSMKHLAHSRHPKLINPIRERLQSAGALFIIENVIGAPLQTPTMLCGTMFGLNIWRHRIFESNFTIPELECQHVGSPLNPFRASSVQRYRREVGRGGEWIEAAWRKVMGVSWMQKQEAREAIPPAYTEYIGRQII